MDFLESAANYYRWADSISDQRIQHWFLVNSPLPTYGIVLLYLTFVLRIGPRFMEHREAFSLKPLLVVYNMALSLLNLHICIEIICGAIGANYTFPCAPFDLVDRPPQMRIAAALWWYYFSKVIELFDTVFFVLRKKKAQLSFLHVYHHSTMPLIWWIGVKWVAGGQSTYAAFINAFVHVIMYFYYAMAALGPHYQKFLWWKKYLTQMQLIQFCFALGHAVYSYYIQCPFPNWMYFALMGYMVSFLILFGNFYIQSYIKGKRLPVAGYKQSLRSNGEMNGSTSVANHFNMQTFHEVRSINNGSASIDHNNICNGDTHIKSD